MTPPVHVAIQVATVSTAYDQCPTQTTSVCAGAARILCEYPDAKSRLLKVKIEASECALPVFGRPTDATKRSFTCVVHGSGGGGSSAPRALNALRLPCAPVAAELNN